jgi:tetratricopeptide (TPR) repeat protein
LFRLSVLRLDLSPNYLNSIQPHVPKTLCQANRKRLITVAIDREKIIQAAQKFASKQRYDKAIAEYQKIIQEEPGDVRTLLKIGDAQLKMGSHAAAIDTYERVGKIYEKQGFAVKAIAVYMQIRDIITRHVPALEDRYGHVLPKLAELYQQRGLISDALSTYDEVATRHLRAGRDAQAVEIFKKVVELDPSNPLPHLRLAEALARVKDLDGSVEQFSVAADILLRLGRRDDAIKVVERLLVFKQTPEVAKRAAHMYLDRNLPNDGMQALAKLQIVFQANPKDLDTLTLLAKAFEQIGQLPKAVEVYKEMARIAKEQGKTDIYRQAIDVLLHVAPNDEAVRRLASTQSRSSIRPPQTHSTDHSEISYSVEEISVDDLEMEEVHEYEDSVRPPGYASGQRSSYPPRSVAEVSVPSTLEVAEDYASHHSINPEQYTQQALADALAYRQARHYPKAVEILRIALEMLPASMPLREQLRDVLLEMGDAEGAIGEMITLASIAMENLEGERAVAILQDVLAMAPTHHRAREMMLDLGYTNPAAYSSYPAPNQQGISSYPIPADPNAGYQSYPPQPEHYGHSGAENELYDQQPYSYNFQDQPQTHTDAYNYQNPGPPPAPRPRQNSYEVYDPNQPLPSYDLEELEPVADSGHPIPLQARGGSSSNILLENDEPFGEPPLNGPESIQPAPLPSFDLDEDPFAHGVPQAPGEVMFEDAETHYFSESSPPPSLNAPGYSADDIHQEYSSEQPSAAYLNQEHSNTYDYEHYQTPDHSRVSHIPAQASQLTIGGESIEEVLEEVDFFSSRGLYEDAQNILQEQLQRFPNHPLLIERYQELQTLIHEATIDQPVGSRTRPLSTTPPASTEDNSFDIAAGLDSLDDVLDSFEPTEEARPEFASGSDQVDVEAVFAKFKQGVKAQVSDADSATHYDLGVAYKEMGLIEDSIQEFVIAARDPKRECVCLSMVGVIEMERGNMESAVGAFLKALRSSYQTTEQTLALNYEVANIYESRGDIQSTIEYLRRVVVMDASFRDAKERLDALKPHSRAPNPRIMTDEEFDSVFDDILGSGKLPLVSFRFGE